MRKSPFKGRESGTSLVELLIGVALLSVIGTFSAQFFARLNRADAEVTARMASIGLLVDFANTIDRDLKFRRIPPPPATMPSLCAGALCVKPNFSFKRMIKVGATEVDYTVFVDNDCVAMPTNMRQRHKDLDLSSVGIKAIQDNLKGGAGGTNIGQCLKAMNCSKQQIPRTKFRTAGIPGGVVNPIYPPSLPNAKVVNGQAAAASAIIGAATCVSGGNPTADRVTVEVVILAEDSAPRIEKKELVIPHGNVANIQMLPN